MTRRTGAVLSQALVLAAMSAVLLWAGGHGLDPPPLTSPAGWPSWFEERDPVVAAFAVVRLGGVAAAWYLGAVTGAGLAARALRLPTLGKVVEAVTIPALRRALATAAAVGAATGAVASATHSTVLVHGAALSHVVDKADDPEATPPTISMRRIPAEPEEPARPPGTPPARDAAGATRPSEHAPLPERWTVEPGQCFWTIAETVLAQAWGRPPADPEIVPYWLRLIEANRATLLDPNNADLVYPGDVFTLPMP